MKIRTETDRIQHDERDFGAVVFSLGCAASLLGKALAKIHLTSDNRHKVIVLKHAFHTRTNRIPGCNGEVLVIEISATCDENDRPVKFYHLNPVDAESLGCLSWDGKTLTPPQSIAEIVARHYISQQISV